MDVALDWCLVCKWLPRDGDEDSLKARMPNTPDLESAYKAMCGAQFAYLSALRDNRREAGWHSLVQMLGLASASQLAQAQFSRAAKGVGK